MWSAGWSAGLAVGWKRWHACHAPGLASTMPLPHSDRALGRLRPAPRDLGRRMGPVVVRPAHADPVAVCAVAGAGVEQLRLAGRLRAGLRLLLQPHADNGLVGGGGDLLQQLADVGAALDPADAPVGFPQETGLDAQADQCAEVRFGLAAAVVAVSPPWSCRTRGSAILVEGHAHDHVVQRLAGRQRRIGESVALS